MVRILALLAFALVATQVAALEKASSSALRGSADTRALQEASPDRLRPWPTRKKVVADETVDTRALQEDSPDRRRYSEPTQIVDAATRALQASPDRLRPWPTRKKVVADEISA